MFHVSPWTDLPDKMILGEAMIARMGIVILILSWSKLGRKNGCNLSMKVSLEVIGIVVEVNPEAFGVWSVLSSWFVQSQKYVIYTT